MKKIMFLFVAVLSIATASAEAPVPEKVLSVFASAFPGVTDAKWFTHKHGYDVNIETDSVKLQIRYDLNGNVLSTRRYYYAPDLHPYIKAKIMQKYPSKRIYGVTEITREEEMFYEVILEDTKMFMHVQCDPTGQMTVVKKFNKA